ncbi:hypothetical protein GOP47_0023702 [Adiantum capillus-veneris]|uniref:Cyclin-dependent kinase inhibitor domain-containing protein n=1 Tax=Adiantum capillus-veneris TaxID=13818 RepID=A0A9D4U526_ADICA|nr:hypothetical protein GOP47_0023702 [Adiantum capillus-veneris]
MGKYMRKGKGVGKMAVIEEALGVRTRARALALQRDSKQDGNVGLQPPTDYMELRSRRFEKASARVGEESPSQPHKELFQKHLSSSKDESFKLHGSPRASKQHDARGVSRKPVGILTRHQRQALAQLAGPDNMEVEAQVEHSRRADLDFNAEVEQFFGESPMVAGPSSKDRHRRRTRESTPDSYAWSMEAPGSTSRTRRARRSQGRSLSAPPFNRANEAPSTSEIEAFFQGAEQQERRRFIERYNFDPANERPLRGRYEWTNT